MSSPSCGCCAPSWPMLIEKRSTRAGMLSEIDSRIIYLQEQMPNCSTRVLLSHPWLGYTPPAVRPRLWKRRNVPRVDLFDIEATLADEGRNVTGHVATLERPAKERF